MFINGWFPPLFLKNPLLHSTIFYSTLLPNTLSLAQCIPSDVHLGIFGGEKEEMGKSVLIVDDAMVVRQLVGMTLKGAGYSVIEAINGKDALERLNSSHVDMIISDLNMPLMNGIEFIREARVLASYRFTPIVMLSTVSEDKKVQEGKQAGASGWLYKPFNSRQILETVRKFIS